MRTACTLEGGGRIRKHLPYDCVYRKLVSAIFINLTTARALGLTIPDKMLSIVDEGDRIS
jgi:hypothetical protein